MRPSSRFSAVLRSMRASTRSPCIASLMFVGRHVHVGRVAAGLVGNDEAESGRVHLKAPDDEIHLVGQADAAALGLDELAGRDERLQQPPKCRAFFLRNLERLGQLARGGGMRDFLTHQFQYLFSGKHCVLNIDGFGGFGF